MNVISVVDNKFNPQSQKQNKLCELEKEYDLLYQEAVILIEEPESDSYQRNKRLRTENIRERTQILKG
jgi:hypothetical protein